MLRTVCYDSNLTHKNGLIMLSTPTRNAGFTLIELAIVITVISLVSAFILNATVLRRNYEVIAAMDGVSKLTQATAKFKEIYGGLPGDLYNATDKFGATAPDGNTISNGNGNGLVVGNDVDGYAETNQFFQHLMLGGLIEGNYTGGANLTPTSLMPGKIQNSYYTVSSSNPAGSNLAIYFSAALDLNNNGSFSAAEATQAVITPVEMNKIETKYDDGVPNTGNIRALQGNGLTGDLCYDAATQTTLVLSNTVNACYFYVVTDAQF
jgi:prepilin-type N-terminal cleavage/methylation domain-containing protein